MTQRQHPVWAWEEAPPDHQDCEICNRSAEQASDTPASDIDPLLGSLIIGTFVLLVAVMGLMALGVLGFVKMLIDLLSR